MPRGMDALSWIWAPIVTTCPAKRLDTERIREWLATKVSSCRTKRKSAICYPADWKLTSPYRTKSALE
jgi:hypothetical protein